MSSQLAEEPGSLPCIWILSPQYMEALHRNVSPCKQAVVMSSSHYKRLHRAQGAVFLHLSVEDTRGGIFVRTVSALTQTTEGGSWKLSTSPNSLLLCGQAVLMHLGPLHTQLVSRHSATLLLSPHKGLQQCSTEFCCLSAEVPCVLL